MEIKIGDKIAFEIFGRVWKGRVVKINKSFWGKYTVRIIYGMYEDYVKWVPLNAIIEVIQDKE